MKYFYRGDTPTLTFVFPQLTVSSITAAVIKLVQAETVILTKGLSDCRFIDYRPDTLTLKLSSSETEQFTAGVFSECQIQVTYNNNVMTTEKLVFEVRDSYCVAED